MKLAVAVPEVQIKITGCPTVRAKPKAKKPAERSSNSNQIFNSWGRRANPIASGVEREPGHTTAW
jgi:hypothetical protein